MRRLARASEDADQTRRRCALAVIYDDGSRRDAAKTGGVGRRIIRYWVERYNAEGPDGRVTRKALGAPSKLDDAQRAALDHVVERGPDPEINDRVRWRLLDLAAWVWNSVGPSVSAATLSRERTALGFSKLSARPRHHAQDKGACRVMPRCDSETMTAHIAVISAMVAPGAHAVVILDQAGWHLSGSLAIPANITLLP